MSKPSLVLIYYVFHKTYTKAKIKKDETKIKQKTQIFSSHAQRFVLHLPWSEPPTLQHLL